MLIEVKTNNNIDNSEEFIERVRDEVEGTLGRFADWLTRVEVHVQDFNSKSKSGIDKRCAMEARPRGHQPIAADHEADTIEVAVAGAAEKLARVLDRTMDKLSHHKGNTPMGGDTLI